MDKEAEPVISALKLERKFVFCRKKVYIGTIGTERVGVVICGVGKVNAAIGTQIAIDELGAERIINIGVAGGLNDGVQVGNIYGIYAAVQYDFDLSEANGTAIGTLDECKTNYLPLATSDSYPLKKIGTGDRFNDSKADFDLLTKVLNADIRDMECGAIIQVCLYAKVKCYAFKVISDIAGSSSTIEQYNNNLSLCFETIRRELENILKSAK